MPVTIKHVAEAAGVSASTVSRVLTGDVRISEPTRERVRKAISDLGYHPNAIARSLVRQTSNTIGLVMSRPPRAAMAIPFYPEIIGGITEYATLQKYNVMLVSSNSRDDECAQAMQLLRNRKVEGIIHLASRVHDRLITTLSGEKYPFVVIGRMPGLDVPIVNNDNIADAAMAVGHLMDEGYRRIAFVGGSPDLVVTCDRLEGYRQALASRGIAVRNEWIICSESTMEAGMTAAARLLALIDRPEAVFAMDDTMAAGVLNAANKLGYRVPGDLAVMGYNDDPVSSYVEPPLTTVRIPIYEMGRQAARLLIMAIEGGTRPPGVVMPAELIVRQSTRRAPSGESHCREGLS